MSIKVLVADDSITIQKVIGIIFSGDEYSLTVVDNGKTAVDKAREIIPDILLIDALMPGMTGYEVSESIRATPSLATKPILILTGSFEPFDEEKAKTCGADDFISKPFESQQIITKVKELLEIGKTREIKKQATPTPAVETTTETVIEPVSQFVDSKTEASVPIAPPIEQSAPADIWGAFTPEIESPAQNFDIPEAATQTIDALEPDVFAIVTEENDTAIVQSPSAPAATPCHTGSQWIPVEENTFEFEEKIATPPQSTFNEVPDLIEEPSFGDIAFEDSTPSPVAPSFTATEQNFKAADENAFTMPTQDFANLATQTETFATNVAPAEPFAPLADPSPTFITPTEVIVAPVTSEISTAVVSSTNITEEQLKAALASVSKDVIERIVWEVVPDLAEALIREAIRKIKEGV